MLGKYKASGTRRPKGGVVVGVKGKHIPNPKTTLSQTSPPVGTGVFILAEKGRSLFFKEFLKRILRENEQRRASASNNIENVRGYYGGDTRGYLMYIT